MERMILFSMPPSQLADLIDSRLDHWADKKLKQLLKSGEVLDNAVKNVNSSALVAKDGKEKIINKHIH